MAKMKYVVHNAWGFEQPVIFCESESHHEMISRMGVNKSALVSAGFVSITDGRVYCYGESVTLMVRARKERDSDLITRMIDGDV